MSGTPQSGAGPATTETGFISAGTIGSLTIEGMLKAGTDLGLGLAESGLINAARRDQFAFHSRRHPRVPRRR